MSASAQFNSVEAYKAYVEEFAQQLISKLFIAFRSGSLFTLHEGVKGKKTLTELTVANLVTRYSRDFTPVADAIDFQPRTLEVFDAKVDLKFVPKDFESSYLGMFRQKGQDSMDMPFIAYILDKLFAKIASEQENAIWKAEAAGVPASTDLLTALFNGVHKIIADEITATNLTPVVTGAITNTNGVASLEAVYSALGSQYQDIEVDVFCSTQGRIRIAQDYRERYGKFTTQADGSIRLDIGQANIHALPGVKEHAILITPRENIHYGIDGPMDASMFNFEQEDRSMKMWMDFKMGVQLGIVNDEIIAANDQH